MVQDEWLMDSFHSEAINRSSWTTNVAKRSLATFSG